MASEEIAVASIAAVLGKNFKSSEIFRSIGSDFEHLYRRRRRGMQPVAYRDVIALGLSDMRTLLEEASKKSAAVRQAIGKTAIDVVIGAAQQMVRDSYAQQGIKPRLDKEMVEHFLGLYALPAAPAPLDKSPALSPYGRDWAQYAACQDEDPELFFLAGSEGSAAMKAQAKEAKKFCAKCRVKGDCLLEALNQRSQGIAGGFTETERKKLDPLAKVWIENSKQSPKA